MHFFPLLAEELCLLPGKPEHPRRHRVGKLQVSWLCRGGLQAAPGLPETSVAQIPPQPADRRYAWGHPYQHAALLHLLSTLRSLSPYQPLSAAFVGICLALFDAGTSIQPQLCIQFPLASRWLVGAPRPTPMATTPNTWQSQDSKGCHLKSSA